MQAIRLAESQGQLPAIASMRQHLEQYERHQPWRE